MAAFSPVQIGSLAVLFIAFLAVPSIVKVVDTSLDTLPMRFASVILVLGVLSYDRFIALALFLVVAAIYIQHHHNDVMIVLGPAGDKNSRSLPLDLNGLKDADAMRVLQDGDTRMRQPTSWTICLRYQHRTTPFLRRVHLLMRNSYW